MGVDAESAPTGEGANCIHVRPCVNAWTDVLDTGSPATGAGPCAAMANTVGVGTVRAPVALPEPMLVLKPYTGGRAYECVGLDGLEVIVFRSVSTAVVSAGGGHQGGNP